MSERKSVGVPPVGVFWQDEEFADWWIREATIFPFFDGQKLKLVLHGFVPAEDKNFPAEAGAVLSQFLKKGNADRLAISEPVHKNCREFLEAVGYEKEDDAMREIEYPDEIWRFVQPQVVYVKRNRYDNRDIYISVECNCDWEREHGLQLVFRRGETLTRVSQVDGHLT